MIAASFGSGDYVGGRASAQSSTVAVLLVSQAFGLVGAAVLVLLVSARVAPHDIWFGALAGAANVLGLALLYHGLAHYTAGVVAPVTAVVGALVPITWGLAHGERPSAVVLTGVVLAVGAGALIASEPGTAIRRSVARGAPQAAAAGLALGSALVLFSEASTRSGQYPLLAARVVGFAMAAIAVLWLRRSGTVQFPRGSARALAIGAGAFDLVATALLIVAVRRDLLSVVAPVVSLAPGFTVLLAWRLTGEHLKPIQRVGLVAALIGLALVAAG